MLTGEKMKELKQRLLDERKRSLERIEAIDQGGLHEPMGSSISELSLYDNHPGDVGSEVFERSKDFALRDGEMLMVRAIDDALERMEKGSYGRCDVCGDTIPPARLEAVPYTTRCLRCKKGDEEMPGTGNRPVEEDVMGDIYARPFEDGLDNVEFDWEDSFQEVAGWNEHAARSQSGSYYGGGEPTGSSTRGSVDEVDGIPYEVGDDGVIYRSFRDMEGGDPPDEIIDVGFQHTGPE
ncbi:MAG: TraR/DksA C4-type zinc finger protein [Bacillota bacterium]